MERGFYGAAGWGQEGRVLSLALPHSAGGPGLTIILDVPQFPSLETAQLSALLQLWIEFVVSKFWCLLRQLWETDKEQLAKEAKEGIK